MSSLTKKDVEKLRAEFDRQLDVGLHHGAQLAVYVDGELAVNFAGGIDGPDGEQTTPETRHLIFSCTKPLAGVGLHQLRACHRKRHIRGSRVRKVCPPPPPPQPCKM